MIPDEFNLSSHELQILSELDSKQYGLLKLAATEHAKKRALVAKVMIRDGLRGCLGGKSVENVGLFIACVSVLVRARRHDVHSWLQMFPPSHVRMMWTGCVVGNGWSMGLARWLRG